MKVFENHHEFATPFERLTLANWRKYPNIKAPHVTSVDVLNRQVTNGVLRTERLITCHQAVPAILKTLGVPVSETAYFRETSLLDPRLRTFTATTTNLTLRSLMQVEETCVFAVDPVDAGRCLFTQRGHVTAVTGLSYLSRFVEDAAVSRMHANSNRGRDALLLVVDTIKREYDVLEEQVSLSLEDMRREIIEATWERTTWEKARVHFLTMERMRNAYNLRTLEICFTSGNLFQ